MSKNLDITVDISSVSSTGALGFGVPLILVSKATKEVPYKKCASLKEVAAAISDTSKTSETYKIAELMFGQTNAPKEVAIYQSTNDATTAIAEVEEKDWRQLIVVIGESDTKTESDIATVVESLDNKMYFVTVSEISTLANLKDKKRTVAFFYDLKKEKEDTLVYPHAVAALVGESAGRTVGSFTYKNLVLKGIEPLDKTSDEVSQIHTAKAITFLEKCGDNVTSEGKNTNGDYIDIIDSNDYIKSQIEYRVQKLLNNSPKIPYTNAGIAAIESEVIGVLEDSFKNGIIDENDGVAAYSTNFKTREEMSASDRKSRIYTGGNFQYTLAGAVHQATIYGELVI